jgi:hypothetical protein
VRKPAGVSDGFERVPVLAGQAPERGLTHSSRSGLTPEAL